MSNSAHPLRSLRLRTPGQQSVFDRSQVCCLLGCETTGILLCSPGM